MKLIPNWKRVLGRSHAVRFAGLAAVLEGCQLILPLFENTISRSIFAALTLLSILAAIFGRLIEQKELHLDPD